MRTRGPHASGAKSVHCPLRTVDYTRSVEVRVGFCSPAYWLYNCTPRLNTKAQAAKRSESSTFERSKETRISPKTHQTSPNDFFQHRKVLDRVMGKKSKAASSGGVRPLLLSSDTSSQHSPAPSPPPSSSPSTERFRTSNPAAPWRTDA